jgi:signal transduction histidine kinase
MRIHEGGKQTKASAAFEIEGVLRHTVQKTASKDRRLNFEGHADGLRVVADEDRFAAVLSHLIDNAIDATPPENGKVDVRLIAQGDEAIIEVEDNGQGMEADFVRNELFKPFKSTKSGGFGIGAYESREFVRELGGNLDVVSTPGKGTTVRIRLPVVNREERAEPLEKVAAK